MKFCECGYRLAGFLIYYSRILAHLNILGRPGFPYVAYHPCSCIAVIAIDGTSTVKTLKCTCCPKRFSVLIAYRPDEPSWNHLYRVIESTALPFAFNRVSDNDLSI